MSNINLFTKTYYFLKTKLLYRWRLYGIGKKSILFRPMQIDCPSAISVGSQTFIAEGAWLMGGKDVFPTLLIGDHIQIGHYVHITALYHISIEDHVLIADRVYITDSGHQFSDIDVPIILQGERKLSAIVIGEGSWIGENVSIVGASIGKHSIIGANAVVTHDIPDYSVAVGIPAKIIKRYNFESGQWDKVE